MSNFVDLTNSRSPSPVKKDVIIIEDDPPARQHLPPQGIQPLGREGQDAADALIHLSRDSGAGLEEQLSNEDLKAIWYEFEHRCNNAERCNHSDEKIAEMINKPVSFVTNFFETLKKDSKSHRTPTERQQTMIEQNRISANPEPISRLLAKLNAAGRKFTYYDYFVWLDMQMQLESSTTEGSDPEEEDDEPQEDEEEDDEPQGEGGAGGAARKAPRANKRPAFKKAHPKGQKKPSSKKAFSFSPEQLKMMEADLETRVSMENRNKIKLGRVLVQNMNKKLLEELNQNVEGWRKVDAAALNSWMSRNKGKK